MENNKIIELNILLKQAKDILKNIDSFDSREKKLKIDSLQEKIIKILEYTINHFPNFQATRTSGFPMIQFWQSSKDFIEKCKQKGIKKDNSVFNFCSDCYKLICQNNKCIFYLDGGVKHRDFENIDFIYNFFIYYDGDFEKIKPYLYVDKKSVCIGNILRKEGSGKVVFENCAFLINNTPISIGKMIIDANEVLGNDIVFQDNKGMNKVRKNWRLWLQNCIDTSEKIIQLYVNSF